MGEPTMLELWAEDHLVVVCPFNKERSIMPAPPTSEAARRNPIPAGRGAPLPSQRQVFEQAQWRAGTGRGRGQDFNLTVKQAEASEEVVASTFLVLPFRLIAIRFWCFPLLHIH